MYNKYKLVYSSVIWTVVVTIIVIKTKFIFMLLDLTNMKGKYTLLEMSYIMSLLRDALHIHNTMRKPFYKVTGYTLFKIIFILSHSLLNVWNLLYLSSVMVMRHAWRFKFRYITLEICNEVYKFCQNIDMVVSLCNEDNFILMGFIYYGSRFIG